MQMQPQPEQRPITYFIVQTKAFQDVCQKLGTLPYAEVGGLIQEFVGTSRAMFDPLPAIPPAAGAPGKEPPPAEPPGKGNGEDLGPRAGIIDASRPGWTKADAQDPTPGIKQEFDAKNDCWWIKDSATPASETLPPDDGDSAIVDPDVDKGEPGGAE